MPNRPLRAAYSLAKWWQQGSKFTAGFQRLPKSAMRPARRPCRGRGVGLRSAGVHALGRGGSGGGVGNFARILRSVPIPGKNSPRSLSLLRVSKSKRQQRLRHADRAAYPQQQPWNEHNQAKRFGFIDPARRSRWSAWLSSRAARCNISFRAPVN